MQSTYSAKQQSLDRRDSAGRTPLLLAEEKGHEDVVKLLLNLDGDLKSQADAGIFPRDNSNLTLHLFAAKEGHEKVVHLLLGKRANIDIESA